MVLLKIGFLRAPKVKIIRGTADRGTAEPAELEGPAEPREMTDFILTTGLNYY